MKSCPKCSRVYADDALNFCLDDGEWLVAQNAVDEPVTAILSGDPPSDANTRIDATATYPSSDASTVSAGPAAGGKSYGKLALIVGSIAVLAILAIGAYKYLGSKPKAAPLSFEKAKLTRLTTTGKATDAAISPDGKYVAHVQDDGSRQSLWVRQTATQSNVQVLPPTIGGFDGLRFSPDGNFIYYNLVSQDYPQRTLFQISTLGSEPKKILENMDRDTISFSPDGKKFVFVRIDAGKEARLVIANADGSGEQNLIVRDNQKETLGTPAWSPDGKRIAYTTLNYETNEQSVYEALISDGSGGPLTDQSWFRIGGLEWTADGNNLLMLATPDQRLSHHQIWELSYAERAARPLTNDLDDYNSLSLTPDSKTLAVVKTVTQTTIWAAPLSDLSRPQQITSGSTRSDDVPAFSPDGRIAYTSNVSGNNDIWISNNDGSGQKQLTSESRVNVYPTFSPDGRSIVFMSDRTGLPHLWTMNPDGTDQHQLLNGSAKGELAPQFSPDGRWIYFTAANGFTRGIGKFTIGSEPVALTNKYDASFVSPSPDGKYIAYVYKEVQNSRWRIAVAPAEGGDPVKTFDLPKTSRYPLKWTLDGRYIAFLDKQESGVVNIVMQPVDGGPIKPLTDFKTDRIFWFDFSRDGKQVAFSRGTQNSDVQLFSGF